MWWEDLTPEMVEEAKKCETDGEWLPFAAKNGIELTDEQRGASREGVGRYRERPHMPGQPG